jgi:DNA-binding transcriptional regulator YhcF (GntR family)
MLGPKQNSLLAALPMDDQARLFPALELIELPLDYLIHQPSDKLIYCYFPTDCVISKISNLTNGDSTEVAIIGFEGMVSVCLFMGGASMPHETLVKSPGYAYRVKSQIIKNLFMNSASARLIFLSYTQLLITQMAQTAVCNRHHLVIQQLSRMLLFISDRLPSNEIVMTQERIALMLGVRREGITEAAKILQQEGLIEHTRGHLKIIDRQGLESRACECYQVVRKEQARLFPSQQAHEVHPLRVIKAGRLPTQPRSIALDAAQP